MRVLVGIPTHKRPRLLRKCIERIGWQLGDHDIRVFVADNDPNEREGVRVVAEMAPAYRFPISATVVPEPGISAVRNAILKEAAKGGVDFIAMIDDDETAAPNWISELIRIQEKWGADVVSGPSHPTFEGKPSPAVAHWFQGRVLPDGPVDTIYGTNNVLLSTRSLYEADWPAFDPAFGLTGGGDFEYFTRMAKRGWRFAWASNAVCFEFIPEERANTLWTIARAYRYGIDDVRVSWLHHRATVAGKVARALAMLAASPALVALAFLPRYRHKAAWKLARAAGVMSALFGHKYLEYQIRH
jgi:succinoglycan biosynthesis protein ExoM